MNQERLKVLRGIRHQIEVLRESLDNQKTRLEEVRDEEQQSFYNMSESLQGSPQGERSEAAIEAMDSIYDQLDNVHDELLDVMTALADIE